MKHSSLLSVILMVVLTHLGQEVVGLPKSCENCKLSFSGMEAWNAKNANRFLKCVQEEKVDVNGLCFIFQNIQRNTVKSTGLVYASKFGLRSFTSSFLHVGADPNIPGTDGQTALMYAAKESFQGLAGDLIKNGANVNAQDEFGLTVLMYAAYGGSQGIVDDLLQNGANISAEDGEGRTAMWQH